MKGFRNILIQFAISFTVLGSVFVGYAAWNDVISDGSPLTHTMWNDLVTQVGVGVLPAGYIYGVNISNGSDASHDIDITVGKVRSADNTENIELNSILTKQIDASWSEGTNGGGLDSGSVGNSAFYYIFLIKNISSGTVDALFSTSSTSPNLPSGYTKKRKIGSIRTDGSANILGGIWQNDNKQFLFDVPVADYITSSMPTSRTSISVSAPPNTNALLTIKSIGHTTTSGNKIILLTNLDRPDQAPSNTLYTLWFQQGVTEHMNSSTVSEILTNSSNQIGMRANVSTVSDFSILTKGWIDYNQ